ncbi:uncharacterized protein FFUJ_05808 [Fusarium fujikuroi IMI 58289]|uniref:Uncharacterized protein n=1 Tax=Gibberella fujikuroi (strain CBS 195.34 / IMI 58289 / NRRL A-6831) TaxID=1279085 RepID=S0E7X1_GIBF5|nr:uncharacterized protein FFUJ_05808 [Fusarium fujikuroi IMI 58289]CCT69887.1 uncharacterized protein FFUJ_05808 [Fusarium fujikuroi IMI 58289]SCN86038.1 uncharacterized protein FFM5_03815 [Fusarium fujikuroi]
MSSETEGADNGTGKVDTAPARKPRPSKPLIPKDDVEAIQKRHDEAIACIHPDTKKHPSMYQRVVELIKKCNVRRGWADTQFYKDFTAWCRVSGLDAKPDHEVLLATLAVHESLGGNNFKFAQEIRNRGLEQWLEQELKKHRPFVSTPTPAEPETPPIKTEPGTRSQGPERGQADSSRRNNSQPANKRASAQEDQQRIVLRDAGTQTDNDISMGRISEPMLEATKAMKENNEKQDEQIRTLMEHNRLLADLLERVQASQLRAAESIPRQHYQGQPQEIIPLQAVNHQPPTYYYERSRVSGNSGQIFRFD